VLLARGAKRRALSGRSWADAHSLSGRVGGLRPPRFQFSALTPRFTDSCNRACGLYW
jgi:hypothetical protein